MSVWGTTVRLNKIENNGNQDLPTVVVLYLRVSILV